jgi:hypothetical protein
MDRDGAQQQRSAGRENQAGAAADIEVTPRSPIMHLKRKPKKNG